MCVRVSLVQLIRQQRDTGNGSTRWRETLCVRAPLRLLDGVLLDRPARAAPAGRGRDSASLVARTPSTRDEAMVQTAVAATASRCAPDASTRPHPTPSSRHYRWVVPRRRRSNDSDTEANLGHVRRVRPAHRGIHREHKGYFFGRQREGDGPSRRLAFARRVDQQFVRGGFNNFLGGGRSSARRGGPERLLVDGATLNKFFVALLEGFICLE